jgi:hypothetical protein
MSVKNYNVRDVVCLIDGFDIASDLLNEDGVIVPAFDEDRASVMSSLDGKTHATFNESSTGTLTFKFYHLSDAKIKILAQMNLQATGLIVIKNKAQTTDLCILDGAVVKKTDFGGFGKGGTASPTITVTFHGNLTVN